MSSWGRILGAASLLGLVCCSVLTSLDGYTGGGGGAPDAAPLDPGDASVAGDGGGFLQDAGVTEVDGCSNTGCFDMPLGFSLVALGTQGADCPSGFTIPTDTVEGPTVPPAACSCGCTVTTQPTCPQNGTITGFYGGGGTLTCPSGGSNLVNTGCGTDGFLGPFAAGNEHRFAPPGATGGACSSAANKDPSKVTYASQGRVCQATSLPRCNEQVCPPQVGGSFAVCIAAAGDATCPAQFPKKHTLGVSASFTCTNNCTCSVTAKCKGKVNYFATPDCSGAAGFAAIADDTCEATVADGGASFASHIYVRDPIANVACNNAGGTAPSTPTVDQLTTVCCSN